MKELNNFPIVLTANDICEILHVSKPTAYEIMNRADFPLMKVGRCKRVLRDEFFNWIKSKNVLS